jgi:putative addiction module component (TIGR02574 family)
MTVTEQQAVFDAALALPEIQRMLLAERLLDSLRSDLSETSDEELLGELNRRAAEFKRDPSVAIPWSEVISEK